MLAEEVAHATDVSFYFYQMHRDTRLQELVGDSVIIREAMDTTGGGETIRQGTQINLVSVLHTHSDSGLTSLMS